MLHHHAASPKPTSTHPGIGQLRAGSPAVWLRPQTWSHQNSTPLRAAEVEEAQQRQERFRPVLATLFSGGNTPWDGRVRSALLDYPAQEDRPDLWVKADHDLPMTGVAAPFGTLGGLRFCGPAPIPRGGTPGRLGAAPGGHSCGLDHRRLTTS